MTVEGFILFGSATKSISSGESVFTTDVIIPDTPLDVAREIQVQLYIDTSSIISIEINSVPYVINNGVAVIGAVSFSLIVLTSDTVNITTAGTDVQVTAIISGG
jgi:hypothetical protein